MESGRPNRCAVSGDDVNVPEDVQPSSVHVPYMSKPYHLLESNAA